MPRTRECVGWVQNYLMGREDTHTELGGREHAGARMNHFRYHTGMQKPNEETYPGPPLVNIRLLYPHRE